MKLSSVTLQDPEFYQFLKDYDKDLLEFNDEDLDVGKSYVYYGLLLSMSDL